MASCCTCTDATDITKTNLKKLPLICMVQRDDPKSRNIGAHPTSGDRAQSDIQLDEETIRKHFKIPPRQLYLDPNRRPLISFPMTQEDSKHFNLARKYKINQQILDGYLDASEAISAPSVFPYANKTDAERKADGEEDDDVIYVFQLPDLEFKCPIHNETIRTPRVLLRTSQSGKTKKSEGGERKPGGGVFNKPKPWLLSRHTDFDLLSQW